ncbi:MAG: CHAT domain-containing protein [Pyrinomonadaceae bacterium]|nr:CHAT domain-containing protein [Pyrinomonadaceae bacterium]
MRARTLRLLRRVGIQLLPLLIGLPCLGDVHSSTAIWQEKSDQGSVAWTIVPGTSVDREFAADAPHSYQIDLSAGQLFQAAIQQKGIDVVVTLLGPDGQTLDEFSEPVYENLVRKILFIAKTDGNYRLLLRPRQKEVTAGPYQFRAEVPRSATEVDQVRVRATQITKDAKKALGKVSGINLGEAPVVAGKLEEALRIWQSLDDRPMVGECWLSLGVLNSRLSEFTKAMAFFEKAMPLFPDTPEGLSSRATALNNIGDAYLNLGEMRKALEIYQRSLELKREGRSRAITLDNIGSLYDQLGENQLALDYHLQALALFRAQRRQRDEAATLNNLAWSWSDIGDLQKPVEYMLQALSMVREAGDKNGEALYLSSLGNFYFLAADHQPALDYANRAVNLSRAIENRRTEGSGLTLLCRTHSAMGEFEKALEACNRALTINQSIGNRRAEAITITALAGTYEQNGPKSKAVELREAALALYQAVGDPNGELTTLHALGELALENGNLILARKQIERAIDLTETVRVKAASPELRSTYMAGRQQIYESYIDLLMRMHQQEPEKGYAGTALQFSERARARSLLDLMAEARAQIRQGADPVLLEKERSLLERLNAKDAALRKFRGNERTKGAAEAVANEINDLTTQLQLVTAQIRSSSPHYAELIQPQSLTQADIQRQVVDENTVLLEFALGKRQSWLWAVTPTATLTYRLPGRAEIETAARKLYELLIARQPRAGEAEAEVRTRVINADAELSRQAGALSRMLLGPIAAKLSRDWKGKRLLIVAGGPLEYLPFAALPLPFEDNGSRPLIAAHEIVNLPSASVLSVIRRETAGRPAAAKAVAVLADPVFEPSDPRVVRARNQKTDSRYLAIQTRSAAETESTESDLMRSVKSVERGGLSRLPFSREEADVLTSLVPAKSLLKATDFQASRAIATSGELSNYRIIHFATHGLLNSERPEISGLVLSLIDENGSPQDGFLRMHEIYNLRLPADVVVLSACQTGLGKEIKGEGLVGLTRGFMYAGAQRVVASLWQVDDLATAELMKRFYRGMLKDNLRPAAALREAQLEMMNQKRWSSPYFWAAFVIQGEWK